MKRLHAVVEHLLYAARHPLVKAGILACGVSGVIFLVVGVGYWWPVQRDYRNLVESIQTQRKAVVDTLHAANVAQSYRRALEGIAVLEKKLDYVSGQAELVRNLGRLAKKRGVKILSESYEEGKARSGYVPLYLNLTLKGGYRGLRKFLLDVPTLPSWSVVQEVRFERSRGGSRLIKGYIRLITYRKTKAQKPAAS